MWLHVTTPHTAILNILPPTSSSIQGLKCMDLSCFIVRCTVGPRKRALSCSLPFSFLKHSSASYLITGCQATEQKIEPPYMSIKPNVARRPSVEPLGSQRGQRQFQLHNMLRCPLNEETGSVESSYESYFTKKNKQTKQHSTNAF